MLPSLHGGRGCDQDLKMFSLQDSSQKGAIMPDIGFVTPRFPASLSHKATRRPFDSFRFNMQWFIILCYSTIWELSVKLHGCPSKTPSRSCTCFSLQQIPPLWCHANNMNGKVENIFKLNGPFVSIFPIHCVCSAQHTIRRRAGRPCALHGRRTRFCLDAAVCDNNLACSIAGHL